MLQARFLDSFDSVRKHQAPTLTDGQIKLHLLLGETLRISQTQAFDSSAILQYGGEAEFLQLIPPRSDRGCYAASVRKPVGGLCEQGQGRCLPPLGVAGV